MARTIREQVIDRLLTLYVIDRCRKKHGIENVSETKMHKLIFYSEKKLIESRCKTLNYRFVKLLYPTFSAELRKDLAELVELNFLEGPFFSEKVKTQMILEDFREVFANNREIMGLIDSQVDEYAPIETEALVKRTKNMKWRNGIIEDLKNGTPLIYPLKPTRARSFFNIRKEDYEDLAICLSPKISRGMAEAFNELRRGERLSHAEVFG
jgi:hypothetical protein